MFEIPVVNQTQVEVTETLNEDARERNNIESVTNERGMESLHVFKDIETAGPVRDVGPVLGINEKASTDNLAQVSSDGNGENPEGRVSVIESRASSSRGANGEKEKVKH